MSELRAAVRQKYNYCCGYCGVSEIDVGNELEVDHFHPRSHGGRDLIDNLVYACPGCNRNKANYWPNPDSLPHRHLLHPLNDNISRHILTLETGHLEGVTQRGNFHIEWLHLNRSQLVFHRQRRVLQSQVNEAISRFQNSNQQLKKQIAQQRHQLAELNKRIRQLQGRNS